MSRPLPQHDFTNLTCSVCHTEGVLACPVHRPLPHLLYVDGHAIDPRTNRCYVCDKDAAQIDGEEVSA